MTGPWYRAWALAILALLCVLASGCATRAPAGVAASGPAATQPAGEPTPAHHFEVEVHAAADVQAYLERHLDLLRYRTLPDLDDTELERLAVAAQANTRELLATLGYFSPEIVVTRNQAHSEGRTLPMVRIDVQEGPSTTVRSVVLSFAGDIAERPAAAAQRERIREGWTLPVGSTFTQTGWDDAKRQSLRLLWAIDYPLGRIGASRAEIEPQQQSARLSLTLDSGAAFRFGPMQIHGLERYPRELVERIARLKPGSAYDQGALLQAQQRLQDSGYFDSAVLEIDAQADPQAVPVIATVREARRNDVRLGVGISTDSGPRLSVEHTNHQMPLIGWRAVSKAQVDRDTQSIQSELTAPPDADLWQWQVFGQMKNEDAADVRLRGRQLRAGRLQMGEKIDRNYYLQYDRAHTNGGTLNESAQTLSANYAFTQRHFDSLPYPSDGYGLGIEFGGGFTLGGQRDPYLRTRLNWLGVWPLAPHGERQTRASAGRIALRLQAGAVLARDDARLPGTQLFLTGGDTSVRGYAFNSIGAKQSGGIGLPGRYLAGASVEWQRPILLGGRPSEWESTLFIDGGAVADQLSRLHARIGVGAGVRYRSPVGPLQLDLAYGLATHQVRLHLSVGLSF